MPINKHRKSNSKPKQQQQPPPPPKQQPLTTTTNTITSNSNSDSNSTTSKPSLFTKSHHTLLAVTSLSNLRNSSNHHQQTTTTTTHNPSNPIKRSNSISSDQILAHSNFHYITHSNLKSTEHQTKSSSSSSSFTSSFKQSDFFKRSTKLSNPTSTLKSNSSLDLKVLSTSHDSNNKSSSNLKKPNHSTTSLIEPSILIKHNQTNPNRFNLKTKSVNSNSSNIHHHHLSIQSESTNSSSSTFNQFSPTKTLENNSTINESNSGKQVESIDTIPSQKTEPSKKSLEVLNQKIEPTKKPSDNSTKKTESKKSIDNSNKKNEPTKKSIELSNKKSLDTSNKRSLEITNKKNESVTTLGIFSGTSTTSLVSNTSSTNHTQPHHSSMNFSSNNNNNNNNNNTNNSGSSNGNHKPVIRHITSTSTLASTQFTGNHNGFGQKLENPNFGLVLGHQVGGDSNGSLVLRPGDLWSQIVMRVIPLFNGEGHKGFIEDLNEFVIQYISKTISDSPSKSIQKLTNDLQDLLTSGVMSLNHKFSADTLSDERFLIRLMEIWHFFFTGVLPTLEAIFLPLMTDEKLISVLESKNNKLLQERLQQIHLLQQVSSTSGLPPSSTSLLFKIQPKDPNETLVKKSNLGIDVRRIALECFRDSMISSVFNRFYKLLSYLYDDSLEGFNEPLSMDLVNEISHFKRLQMIGLLCGSVPNPEIEALGKLIRSGKADPSYLKEDEDLEPKDDGKCTNGLAGLKTSNPAGNLSLSPTIRSWNKNREFTRRSIRRQLGKSSLLHHHHHHHQASKLSLSSLKTSLDLKSSDPSFSNPNETENETLVQSSSGTGTTGNTANTGTSGQTLHSLESFKFSADHLKHVVQSKINKSMNYFGTQSVSLDDHGSIAEAV